jgi:integrase
MYARSFLSKTQKKNDKDMKHENNPKRPITYNSLRYTYLSKLSTSRLLAPAHRPLILDENDQLLKASNPEWRAIPLRQLYTGVRSSEPLLIKLDQINWNAVCKRVKKNRCAPTTPTAI